MKTYIIISLLLLPGCVARKFYSGYEQGVRDYQDVKRGDALGIERAGYLCGVLGQIEQDRRSGQIFDFSTWTDEIRSKAGVKP